MTIEVDPIKKPTQADQVAYFDATTFIKELNDHRAKDGLPPLKTGPGLIEFKQWLAGTQKYDGSGLRDVVNTYGYAMDSRWAHELTREDEFDSRLDAAETKIAQLQAQGGGSPLFPFED